MTRHIGTVASVICLFFFISCKTKQPTENITKVPGHAQALTAQELFHKIDSLEHTYTNLNIKYAANIKLGKDENSVRGKLKIRKDSCVWVTALPIGIEAARMVATKQEAGMINYLKKNYFLGEYDLLSAQIGYNVNYDIVQSILTGAPVFLENRESYSLFFQTDKSGSTYTLSPYPEEQFQKITEGKELSNKSNLQSLSFSSTDYTLTRNTLYDAPQRRFLQINYSNYQTIGGNRIPFRIDITIKTPKETGIFVVEYTKVEANQPDMEYPFTVPDSYTRIKLK